MAGGRPGDPDGPWDIPTEIGVGPDEGLPVESAASFDDLQPIRRTFLTGRAGALGDPRRAICRALGALADCPADRAPAIGSPPGAL